MAMQRIILEMGTGNDLYGMDYTKAAVRAVQDALHHSSITLFRTLDIDRESMQVEVTIGVQNPDAADQAVIKQQIPYGSVTVNLVNGGLNVVDKDNHTTSIVATAAIVARVDVPENRYVSSN